MTAQFFQTALVITGLFAVAGIIFFVLYGYACDEWSYDAQRNMFIMTLIFFLTPIAFWIVVGTICALSNIWGWGLVV